MCLRESPTRPDINRPAQPQKLARVLKFRLQNLEILYYLSSEQQRRSSDCADAQADLCLCCSHMTWHTFSWPGSYKYRQDVSIATIREITCTKLYCTFKILLVIAGLPRFLFFVCFLTFFFFKSPDKLRVTVQCVATTTSQLYPSNSDTKIDSMHFNFWDVW